MSFKTPSPAVVSLYLDIDGGRSPGAALSASYKGLADSALGALTQELQAVEQALEEPRLRSERGLAVFSSRRFRLLRICTLPEPVKTRLVVDDKPFLGPLLNLVDQYQRYGVAVVTPQGARFLEYFMGRVRELPEQAISAEGACGSRAALARAAAARLETLSRQLKFQRVIVACAGDLRPLVIELLHRFLRDNLIVDDVVDHDWSAEAVRAHICAAESQARRLREFVAAQRLIDEAGDRAALGLRRTLDAAQRGRAKTLLVRDGFTKLGRRCAGCARLSLDDTKCAACGAGTETVFDLIGELCDRAMEQGAQVLRMLHRTPLDNVGYVGVELRSVSAGTSLPLAAPQPAPVP